MKYLAANIPIAPNGGFVGFGPLGTGQASSASLNTLQTVISSAIALMTIIAFIWFIFIFMTGAISIVSSGGDKQALESAKKRITTGLIGIVVVISAIFLFDLIGIIFGVNFLTLGQLFLGAFP